VALPAQSAVAAPSPVYPGAGRSSALPRDPGRATEVLYRRHGDTVFRYAWHLLGRREDAEDATQATFLAVHGALAGGTAVLESGAWVLRIARNECMGRLRQTARRPAVRSLDDGFDPPAEGGGVERSAELRDEMRTARETLAGLPVPEREAFVLREWLGLEAGEAALALGMSAVNVEGLAARARRKLVLTVGGLEPAIGCTGTRAALESGSLDRAAKVHLLRCPVCRGVRRALRPPETAARSAVAQRLSAAIPGFASGGGGILAALTAKAAAAPVLTKTAAIVVAAVAAGGAAEQAIVNTVASHHARSHGGPAQVARVASPTPVKLEGGRLVALATPVRANHASVPGTHATTRGDAATPTGRDGSSNPGDAHGGRAAAGAVAGRHDSGGGHPGSADSGNSHSSSADSGSVGTGGGTGTEKDSGGDHANRAGSATGTSGGDHGSSGAGTTSSSDGRSGGGNASGTGSDASAPHDSGSGKDGTAVTGVFGGATSDHFRSADSGAGSSPGSPASTTSPTSGTPEADSGDHVVTAPDVSSSN
jgi:RNA polymerase sigma-70 factor (ECF subfamily)